MKRDFWAIIVSTIITLLVYSLSSFAYVQSNYVHKDSFKMVVDSLSRIEIKLDTYLSKDD